MAEITGEKIKALREEMGGVSQEDLARMLGVNVATINRWEKGHHSPSRLAKEKLEGLLEESEARAEGLQASRQGRSPGLKG